VTQTLAVIAEVFPLRRVALVRELTKLHEEVARGLSPQLADVIAARPEVKGECVIVLEGPVEGEQDPAGAGGAQLSLEAAIAEGLAAGETKSALAKRLSKAYGVPRAQVYDQVVALG
jgi:16S rRNA (cytidine1402-2'-O)-methyltransferase